MWKLSAKKVSSAILLPWWEKILLLRTCYWLRCIRAELVYRDFKSVLEDVELWSKSRWVPGRGNSDPRFICKWVERCASNMPGSYTCLPKAFAGYVLCAGYGYSLDLRFGVERVDKLELHAHAWLEINGEVILGYLPDLDKFQAFGQ